MILYLCDATCVLLGLCGDGVLAPELERLKCVRREGWVGDSDRGRTDVVRVKSVLVGSSGEARARTPVSSPLTQQSSQDVTAEIASLCIASSRIMPSFGTMAVCEPGWLPFDWRLLRERR